MTLFLLILFSCALVSCYHEEVTPNYPSTPNKPTVPGPGFPINNDNLNPTINIARPISNSDLTVIEHLNIYANISDNAGLNEVRLIIDDPDGNPIEIEGLNYLKSLNNVPNVILHAYIRLPTVSVVGTYTLVIEAEDMKQNLAKDSVKFNLHAPDFNKFEFQQAFIKNGFIGAMADWEENFLSERSFASGFFYRLDRDSDKRILQTEWEKLVLDFDLRNQSWTVWDANSDGTLSEVEFKNGLKVTKLFDQWDETKDGKIYEEELADGLFDIWDTNRDKKLTRAEYHEKLDTYFF